MEIAKVFRDEFDYEFIQVLYGLLREAQCPPVAACVQLSLPWPRHKIQPSPMLDPTQEDRHHRAMLSNALPGVQPFLSGCHLSAVAIQTMVTHIQGQDFTEVHLMSVSWGCPCLGGGLETEMQGSLAVF